MNDVEMKTKWRKQLVDVEKQREEKEEQREEKEKKINTSTIRIPKSGQAKRMANKIQIYFFFILFYLIYNR